MEFDQVNPLMRRTYEAAFKKGVSRSLFQPSEQKAKLKVFVGTWNVGCAKPDEQELAKWLPNEGHAFDIIAVGLQEARYSSDGARKSKSSSWRTETTGSSLISFAHSSASAESGSACRAGIDDDSDSDELKYSGGDMDFSSRRSEQEEPGSDGGPVVGDCDHPDTIGDGGGRQCEVGHGDDSFAAAKARLPFVTSEGGGSAAHVLAGVAGGVTGGGSTMGALELDKVEAAKHPEETRAMGTTVSKHLERFTHEDHVTATTKADALCTALTKADSPEPRAARNMARWQLSESGSAVRDVQDMIGTVLGPSYSVVKSLVTPGAMMRLVIYVHYETAPLVSSVEASKEYCGIGHVLPNKGGLAAKLDVAGTSLCFVSCHLAAGAEKLKRRNKDCQEILSGLSLGNKHLDVLSQFHHVFLFGDLNYRLQLSLLDGDVADSDTAVERDMEDCWENVVQLVSEKEWGLLSNADQLLWCMGKGECLSHFEEGPLKFPPTYKMNLKPGWHYTRHKIRVPSYCDRILWRSLPGTRWAIRQVSYEPMPSISTSDHKPMRATFEVQVCRKAEFPVEPPSNSIVSPDGSRGTSGGCGRQTTTAGDAKPPSRFSRLRMSVISRLGPKMAATRRKSMPCETDTSMDRPRSSLPIGKVHLAGAASVGAGGTSDMSAVNENLLVLTFEGLSAQALSAGERVVCDPFVRFFTDPPELIFAESHRSPTPRTATVKKTTTPTWPAELVPEVVLRCNSLDQLSMCHLILAVFDENLMSSNYRLGTVVLHLGDLLCSATDRDTASRVMAFNQPLVRKGATQNAGTLAGRIRVEPVRFFLRQGMSSASDSGGGSDSMSFQRLEAKEAIRISRLQKRRSRRSLQELEDACRCLSVDQTGSRTLQDRPRSFTIAQEMNPRLLSGKKIEPGTLTPGGVWV